MQSIKQYFFFILLLSFFGYTQSSSPSLEYLKKQFNTEKNQAEKARIALQIASKINYTNLDEVVLFAQKAYTITKQNKDYNQQTQAIQFLGNVSIIKGNYKQAQLFFSEAKTIYETQLEDNHQGILKTLGSLGIIASEQSNYNQALVYYFEGKKIAEAHHLVPMQIILNNNIGVIYKSTNRLQEALKILNETQELQQKNKDPNRGITLTNMATIYEQLNQLGQTKKYLDKAYVVLKNSQDDRAVGEWHNNMGSYFFKTNNFIKAENHWNQALRYFSKIEDQFGSFDTYFYLAQLKKEQKEVDLAIELAQKAKSLAYKINILEHKTKIERLLSELFETKNNLVQALIHSRNYQVLKDSLVNQETIRKATQTEMNFAFEKEKLLHQKALDKAKNKQWLWALGILVLLLLFGLFYLYKKKQQQKNQLILENQLLDYKQKALHLQMNPHFLFNCLAAISAYIMQNEKEEAAKYLALFSKLMRFTLESSKENWIVIDKEIAGLKQYLILEQLRLNKKFDFHIDKSADMEDDMVLPPMLIQPLVENAIIHGILPKQEKGLIEIAFSVNENQLIIKIKDNGMGIENSLEQKKNQVKLHQSLAISIIKERLEMIQKTHPYKTNIQFQQTNTGTEIVMILPLKYELTK